MGQANQRKVEIKKLKRFSHLLKLISNKYSDKEISEFAKRRKL